MWSSHDRGITHRGEGGPPKQELPPPLQLADGCQLGASAAWDTGPSSRVAGCLPPIPTLSDWKCCGPKALIHGSGSGGVEQRVLKCRRSHLYNGTNGVPRTTEKKNLDESQGRFSSV